MPNNDWFDDFMDYKLSNCEDDDKTSDNSSCLPCILGVLAVLWFVSKLFC